ncbi:MAG: hypothetical protein GY930_07170 [bacterium]|nr:hypothetical protein [bacterium]
MQNSRRPLVLSTLLAIGLCFAYLFSTNGHESRDADRSLHSTEATPSEGLAELEQTENPMGPGRTAIEELTPDPQPEPNPNTIHGSPTATEPTEPPEPTTKHHTGSSTYRWPELIARVFNEDVLRCPNCRGHRTLLTAITDPFAIRRILAHFGLPTEVTPLEPPCPPPEHDLPWEVSLAPA